MDEFKKETKLQGSENIKVSYDNSYIFIEQETSDRFEGSHSIEIRVDELKKLSETIMETLVKYG